MSRRYALLLGTALICCNPGVGRAGELILDLGESAGITLVGALARWDAEGKATAPVDPAAKIDQPAVAFRAERREGNRWVFRNLPAGRYDLVILAGRVRVEGFEYPPLLEFDPFLAPTADAPEEVRETITAAIAKSRHYENKVAPLYMAGDSEQVRVLVQLVRDQPTSYDSEYGAPAATIRHEVWQYTFRHGGWAREKTSRVLDRLLLRRAELQRWKWLWEPRLGGIVIADRPVKIAYTLPAPFAPETPRGWFGD
jgi:hypothetical protein